MVLFLSCPHRLVSMYLLVSCAPSLSVSPALPLSCISHSVLVMSPCFVSLTGFHVPLFVFHPRLPSLSCVPMFAYFHISVKFACLCYFLFILIILSLSHTFRFVPLLLYVLFVPAVFPSGLHPSIPPLVYM